MEYNPLRGAVAEKYGSSTKFAEKLGWSGNKTRAIVSGRQSPTADEIAKMASALEVFDKPGDFMRIFFYDQSPQSGH